jgi:hypothetical protein
LANVREPLEAVGLDSGCCEGGPQIVEIADSMVAGNFLNLNQRLSAASTSLMTRASNFPGALRTNSVNFTGWMLWTLM